MMIGRIRWFFEKGGSRHRNCQNKHVLDKPVQLVIYFLLIIAFGMLLINKLCNRQPSEISLPVQVDFRDYVPFEPDISGEFETDSIKSAKIPKIIHQTWKNTDIPPKFVDGIKSFVDYNPDWKYYLWTDDSAKQFVMNHYPRLAGLWNGHAYKNDKIRIADAIRYVVLYHFGGVYADMDVVNFRSLDGAITKHGCVLIPEPYEQAVLRGGVPFFINNAIMMCRAKHPFFKHLIDHLVDFEIMKTVWDSTGPGYLTYQYKRYLNLPREKGKFILYNHRSLNDHYDSSPYFYQGNTSPSNDSFIYIANSQYFLITLDTDDRYYKQCLIFNELSEMWKRACVNLKRKGIHRKISKFAFTDHKWHFTYGVNNFYHYLPIYSFFTATSIDTLVPHRKIYDGDINTLD